LGRALVHGMKSLKINFVVDTRWRVLWLATLLCVALTVGLVTWQWSKTQKLEQVTQQQTEELRRHLRQPAATPPAGAAPTYALLQQDLNPLFATVENIKDSGVRLRRLEFDARSGAVNVEFELDSMLKVDTLTTALNAGYEQRPWILNTVTASATTNSLPGTSVVRAVWSTQIKRL
jgi:type II secretory pathway component PulL